MKNSVEDVSSEELISYKNLNVLTGGKRKKSKKVKKTIALVENMDYFNLSQSIGIDSLINKKLLAANDIFKFVRNGDIVELAMLNDMDAEIVEFIVNENSKVLNKKINCKFLVFYIFKKN